MENKQKRKKLKDREVVKKIRRNGEQGRYIYIYIYIYRERERERLAHER